jgi:hypothetical protein
MNRIFLAALASATLAAIPALAAETHHVMVVHRPVVHHVVVHHVVHCTMRHHRKVCA